MRFKKVFLATYSVTLALLAVQPVFAQQKSSAPVANIIANERDGAPASISFANGESYKASEAASVLSKYLALNPAQDEMRLKATDKVSASVSIARYTQFYKGIKVEHGAYIIASKDGIMSYMSGNFYRQDAPLNTQPQLTETSALQKALDYTGAKKYIWEIPGSDAQLKLELRNPNATYAPKGELVLIEDYTSAEEPDGKLHLAYHFDIYATEPLSRNDVYVDAVTGHILFTNAIIKHVQAHGNSVYSGPVNVQADSTGGTFTLADNTRGSGVYTLSVNGTTSRTVATEITNDSANYPSSVALDAHWGAEMVYDYWFNKRGRLSYDGFDAPLYSYINYDINYNNAFWGGTAMYYGNGTGRNTGGFDPLVSLDVCAHEIGHGVCQETANLTYSRESGGLNEGFSDIWGAVIEHYADPHEVDATAKNTWEIGEEISATPLRSMAEPNLHGDPDTYGGANWKFATQNCSPNGTTNDYCGVHSNSGLLNKWFYLLSVGGSGINGVGNPYIVAGIGIDTAAQIAFGTEVSLTQTANYATTRTQSINYATAEYGACSKVTEAVIRAWYAVNVGSDYAACTAQVSFASPITSVTENAASNDCPGSHTVTVPVVINGPAPTGGNAVITVSVTGGTAVSGIDYTIPSNTLRFAAGSTTPQFLTINIVDNGNTIDTNKYIDLAFTVAANGSNLAVGNVLSTTRIKISNNDLAPVLGSNNTTRTVGTYDVSSNGTSPFLSAVAQARIQYIMTAQELTAAGLVPNASLTKMGFFVISKASTQPYTDYTVKLAPTNTTIFTTDFIPTSSFTQVYNGSLTTVAGTNTITFANNYVWDGVSNLAVEICFSNTSRATGNDQVRGASASGSRAAYATSNTATSAGGCGMAFNALNVANARPIITFTQDAPPTPIETTATATRKWTVNAGDRTYFYSNDDKKLIAGIWNGTNDLGCVEATVTKEGNGFVPATFAPFANVNRSVKEFSITPTQTDTASYSALFYLTNTELGAGNLTALKLLRTTGATDNDITAANTEIVTISARTTALDYRGFRAAFKGFGRYFFVDGSINLAVGTINAPDNDLRVINNPFTDELKVAYTLTKNETASIKLLDITGKIIYSADQAIHSGNGQFTIPVSNLSLASGNYVLQVIRPGSVFTAKVLKN